MITDSITNYFYEIFKEWGMNDSLATFLHLIISFVLLLLVTFILSKAFRLVLMRSLKEISKRTKTDFDDYLFEHNFFSNLSYLFLLFVIKAFIPVIFISFKDYIPRIESFLDILIVIITIWTFRSFLRTVNSYLKTFERLKDKPIDSYIQVLMIFTWMIGFVLIFSILTGDTPWEFLTALGALSAVILLIFKDSILGFVASIQVAANDTVRIGDWITMQKFDADGFVQKINLNTVLVQNWDNTITSIPTYYLNTEPFTNWRGMEESGGRRIKRSVFVSASSVRFLRPDEIDELEKVTILKDYIKQWKDNVGKKRIEDPTKKSFYVNERNLTNIGVYRTYINLYLKQRTDLHQNGFILICRQLPSTPQGIPLEVYAFSKYVNFLDIEPQKGEIFDHLFAVLPLFSLKVFEYPSGTDSRSGQLPHLNN